MKPKNTKIKFRGINRIMKYYKEKFKIQISETVTCDTQDASQLHQLQVGFQLSSWEVTVWRRLRRDLLISAAMRNHVMMNKVLPIYIYTHRHTYIHVDICVSADL